MEARKLNIERNQNFLRGLDIGIDGTSENETSDHAESVIIPSRDFTAETIRIKTECNEKFLHRSSEIVSIINFVNKVLLSAFPLKSLIIYACIRKYLPQLLF